MKLIASTYMDLSQQFSPDGKKIVFASERSGSTKSGSVTATVRIPGS